MFRIKKQIAEMGVLGINRRNAEYTLRYNPRRLNPLVDDKLQTKKIALKAGIAVPELYIAARCYELTGLGYIGVDLVLDKGKGPLILELNARPGLSIQIANRSGLLPRLKLVEQHHTELGNLDGRLAFSKYNFGHRG